MSGGPLKLASAVSKDPVCGMTVNPSAAKHSHAHEGTTYHFCCVHCLEKFKADPQRYLSAASAKPAQLVSLGVPAARPSAPAKSIQSAPEKYVCPMCPEVEEDKPGACPSCGMALEPEMPSANRRTEYTCPMHPEIVRAQPGTCPI